MKYIFRYTILSHFPHPDNKITQSQLSEALHSVKFPSDKFNVSQLEQICLSCIEKILLRPSDKVVSVIEDSLSPESSQNVPEFNPKDLQTIWQQEKVNVYKSVLQNACPSAAVYKDMQWSVRNVIMRRGQSLNKGNSLISRLHINCLQNPSQPESKTSIALNINKKGLQRMYTSLLDCQNAINQILMSEQ